MERIDRDLRTESQVLDAAGLDARLRPHGPGSAKAGLFDTLMLQLISNPSRSARHDGGVSLRTETFEAPRDARPPETPSPLDRPRNDPSERPTATEPARRTEGPEKSATSPGERAEAAEENGRLEQQTEAGEHDEARLEHEDRPRTEKVSSSSDPEKRTEEELISEIAALIARFLAREAQGAREAGARERDRIAKNAKTGAIVATHRPGSEPTERIRVAAQELLREANRLLAGRAAVSLPGDAVRNRAADAGVRAVAARQENSNSMGASERATRNRFHERIAKLLSHALEAAGLDRGASELRVVSIEVTSVRRVIREIDPRVRLAASIAPDAKSAEDADRVAIAARKGGDGAGREHGEAGHRGESLKTKEFGEIERGASSDERAHANAGQTAAAKKGDRIPIVLKTESVPQTTPVREDARGSARPSVQDAVYKVTRESGAGTERTHGSEISGRLSARDLQGPHEPKKTEPAPVDPRLLIAQLENPLTEAAHKAPTSIRVSLDPEHLGRVTLDVSIKDGVVSARIETEGRYAKEALDAGRDQLRNTLEARGLKVGEISVGLGSGSEGDTAQRQSQAFEPPTRHAAPRGEPVPTDELDPAVTTLSARTLSSDLYPESTVNVRV